MSPSLSIGAMVEVDVGISWVTEAADSTYSFIRRSQASKTAVSGWASRLSGSLDLQPS